MRAVVQRVSQAAVDVGGERVAHIGRGLLVLLGVGQGDTEADARYLADKVAGLRIFADEGGKMNLSVEEIGGEVLVVSQFTLYGDTRKGRRPNFTSSAPPEVALPLYQLFVKALAARGLPVQEGRFGEMMAVSLINDGPVTLIVESPSR
jgi:D-tyrosyl-tRNA(Tyr) deacylase